MLRLAEDLGANWLLDLWEVVPTPDKAVRVRETTVARVLKGHRIRRFDAAHVLSELRMPALTVAQKTIEAATAHIRVLAEQLRLINRQLAAAERQLDRLCKELAEPAADDANSKAAGQRVEQDDVTILSSLPGVGRIILATLLAEAGY